MRCAHGCEDFGYDLPRKPGCVPRLGNGEGSAMLRNSRYDVADDNLPIGAADWTRLAERYLGG